MAKNRKKNQKNKNSKLQAKLICNPGSGSNGSANALLEETVRCLLNQGIAVDVALAHPKKKATPIAQKAAKDGYKLVIAMGGDGTIEAVMRGLVGSKAQLGIIPIGTYNNVAKSLGIPNNLEQACAIIQNGSCRKLDIGRVKTKKHAPFYFFETAAVGLTAALYPKSKNLTKSDEKNRLAKLRDAIETFVNYSAPKISLKLEGESWVEAQSLLVSVNNTPAFGMTFMVAPNASLEDGLMDISLYPGFSKADLIAYFARIANEGFSDDGRIQRYRAHKVKIMADPPQDVMADGIMLGQTPAKIRILPGALRVLVPETPGLAAQPEPKSERMPAPVAPVPQKATADLSQQENK